MTERFGEYVLFQPPARGVNWVLYLAGPLMLLLALFAGWRFLRSRNLADEGPPALSADERERLDRIMRD